MNIFLKALATVPGGGVHDIAAAMKGERPLGDKEAAAILKVYRDIFTLEGDSKKPVSEAEQRRRLRHLAAGIRQAWLEKDSRSRRWYIMALRNEFATYADQTHQSWQVPPLTQIERILVYFEEHPTRFRVCKHGACPNGGFYIPKGRNTRTRCCSRECAVELQRISKLKSWHQHKKEWRKL